MIARMLGRIRITNIASDDAVMCKHHTHANKRDSNVMNDWQADYASLRQQDPLVLAAIVPRVSGCHRIPPFDFLLPPSQNYTEVIRAAFVSRCRLRRIVSKCEQNACPSNDIEGQKRIKFFAETAARIRTSSETGTISRVFKSPKYGHFPVISSCFVTLHLLSTAQLSKVLKTSNYRLCLQHDRHSHKEILLPRRAHLAKRLTRLVVSVGLTLTSCV